MPDAKPLTGDGAMAEPTDEHRKLAQEVLLGTNCDIVLAITQAIADAEQRGAEAEREACLRDIDCLCHRTNEEWDMKVTLDRKIRERGKP